MMENWTEWASGHGQITKIRLSEGNGGTTITPAAQFGYDCHGLEGYLGNVGLGCAGFVYGRNVFLGRKTRLEL